jgi:hypothetical protein
MAKASDDVLQETAAGFLAFLGMELDADDAPPCA